MNFIQIDRAMFPAEELESAKFIEQNLITLKVNAEDFRHSADLYLFAHDQKMSAHPSCDVAKMKAWMRIAGRNGSIAAYAFLMVMELINKTRVKAPTIWAKANVTAKESATKTFATEFPNIAGVRNSTAHPGQLGGHRDGFDEHKLKAPHVWGSGGVFGAGSLVTDSMSAFEDKLLFGGTYKGTLVEYELSARKADQLFMVADLYRETFLPLYRICSA